MVGGIEEDLSGGVGDSVAFGFVISSAASGSAASGSAVNVGVGNLEPILLILLRWKSV